MAKGVCIILVVLSHIDGDIYDFPNFQALRMPLYFLLSGIFFKHYAPKVFIIKKVNNIIIPFLFWLIVSDIWNIWYCQYKVDFSVMYFIKDPLCRGIRANGALWFLVCLFITNIIYYCVYLLSKGENKRICVVTVCLAAVGCWLSVNEIKLPLWIDTSLLALPFFFVGSCCRGISYLSPNYSKKNSLFLGIGLIVISFIIYFFVNNAHIAMVSASINGLPLLAYINSISFVLGILLICKVIKWLPIVSYFGRYSIVVLCVHSVLLTPLPRFFGKLLGHDLSVWERTAIILLICWLAIPLCKRWLPYFVAQKPLFKLNSKELNNQ